jgi:hypothetical protein
MNQRPFHTLVFIFLCLGACKSSLQAQKPSVFVEATVGFWRGWVNYDQSYANAYQAWQPTTKLGAGLEVGRSKKIAFAPSVASCYYRMNYAYHLARDNRYLKASLSLFFTSIELSAHWKPVGGLVICPGLAFLISTGAIGSYEITTYLPNQGPTVTGNYTNAFHKIRAAGTWGPTLAFEYRFTLKNGGLIGPKLNFFLGQESMFRKTLDTPFNPKIAQIGIGLILVFPPRIAN